MSYLLQTLYEWFVEIIWERYGPVAGVITALGLFVVPILLLYLIINRFS